MKTIWILCTVGLALSAAFSPASVSDSKISRSFASSLKAGYVPDGMSPEEYRKLRSKEKSAASKKNLGAYGPQSFKSRSLQAFQKDLEKGKTGHLMPMLDAKEKLQSGKIKESDIPYMQRLGSWDDSDLGKKKKWSAADKSYVGSGWKPSGLDWSGSKEKQGPRQQATKKEQHTPKKGGLFGLF